MAASDGSHPCRRVVLKLSGEALMGQAAAGLEAAALNGLCDQVGEIAAQGVQVVVVVGGGNFFRGAGSMAQEFDRVRADHMGMLATVINGLALVDTLGRRGTPATLLSALAIGHAVEPYRHGLALEGLEAGRVVILVAGTGNPCFTTDTAASLRAVELQADLLIKATKVDALAIAIGTSHGAYKFSRPPTGDILAIDRVKEIHARIPDTHLVMHGSSSVPQEWLKIINDYGGDMGQTYGVPVEEIVEGIKHGVRKVNIDTDLRLASTGSIRRHLEENKSNFDPRKYLTAATEGMSEICKSRYEAFGAAGNASKIRPISMETMFERYLSGELDPRIN